MKEMDKKVRNHGADCKDNYSCLVCVVCDPTEKDGLRTNGIETICLTHTCIKFLHFIEMLKTGIAAHPSDKRLLKGGIFFFNLI
jgi:hypothetical protein